MCVCDIYRTKKYASFSVAYMSCARILKQQASCIYHQTLHEFIYKVTLINIGRQNWYIFFVIITFYTLSKAFLCTPRISKWQPWVFVKFVITKWNYCSYCKIYQIDNPITKKIKLKRNIHWKMSLKYM